MESEKGGDVENYWEEHFDNKYLIQWNLSMWSPPAQHVHEEEQEEYDDVQQDKQESQEEYDDVQQYKQEPQEEYEDVQQYVQKPKEEEPLQEPEEYNQPEVTGSDDTSKTAVALYDYQAGKENLTFICINMSIFRSDGYSGTCAIWYLSIPISCDIRHKIMVPKYFFYSLLKNLVYSKACHFRHPTLFSGPSVIDYTELIPSYPSLWSSYW